MLKKPIPVGAWQSIVIFPGILDHEGQGLVQDLGRTFVSPAITETLGCRQLVSGSLVVAINYEKPNAPRCGLLPGTIEDMAQPFVGQRHVAFELGETFTVVTAIQVQHLPWNTLLEDKRHEDLTQLPRYAEVR